jgi:hypothetical protein
VKLNVYRKLSIYLYFLAGVWYNSSMIAKHFFCLLVVVGALVAAPGWAMLRDGYLGPRARFTS